MNYLFFDTETNGFPPHANMTQLAFILTNESGEILYEYQSIIKPKGWIVKDVDWYLKNEPKETPKATMDNAIKKGGFFTDNNISTARCEKEGVPVFDALRELQDNLKKCDYKVAHNIPFDNKIILKEMKNNGVTPQLFQYKKGIDTMKTTTDFCKLPGKYGNYKWPKLTELHNKLFREEFEAHDALSDVKAMKRCFFELKNKHNFYNNL